MDVPAEMLQNKDFVGGGGVGGEGEMKEEPGFDDSEYGPDSESGGAEPGRQRAKKRKGGKNDGDGDFVPPQHEISGDGSFDFGDDNGTEGNGHNNGSGGGRAAAGGATGTARAGTTSIGPQVRSIYGLAVCSSLLHACLNAVGNAIETPQPPQKTTKGQPTVPTSQRITRTAGGAGRRSSTRETPTPPSSS